MRHSEIRARPATADTHPFVADIAIAPAAFAGFERAMEHRHDVRLLARIDRPDAWVVHVACASETVRAGLRDAWA